MPQLALKGSDRYIEALGGMGAVAAALVQRLGNREFFQLVHGQVRRDFLGAGRLRAGDESAGFRLEDSELARRNS